MHYTNITPEQITNELYNIFSDDRRAAQYLTGSHPQYLGVLGWAGPMSPMNRAAFLSAFGAEQVAKAEQEARARVAEYRAAVAASTYHRNEMAADAAELVDDVPAVGSFVWAVTSWLKGEGGPAGELEHLEEYDHREEYGHIARVLVEVAAVEHVSPAEFLKTETAYSIAARHQEDGGSRYDENDPHDLKGRPMAWAVGVVVECGGRWYIIDPEGYNYSRYLLFPADFRAIYRAELSAITEAREAREAAERAEAQRQADARRADYVARCARWSPLMEEVRPLIEAERAAYGTREKSQIRKASAKLSAARRRNLVAMASALYPGVKFSAKKWDGWGGSYELSWTDGPTEDTLKQTADLKLFERSRDTFDGMTDCAGVECAEFVEFADKYLGCHGEIRLNRTTSEAYRAEIRARILAAVPGIPTEGRITGNGQQSAICAMFRHVYASYIVENLERYGLAGAVAYIARCTDATPTPAPEPDPTGTDGTPSDGSIGAAYGDCEKSQNSAAPADGLELVDLAGGGVAVTGDSRTTYKARKEIKAHGATWNKAAKQWEAHDPAAVAALREWFGVTVQDATPTDDPTPADGVQGAAYGSSEKSQLPADMIQRLAAGESVHKEVNAKHPGSVVLFRVADFYASTFGDGERVASVTGATLCTDSNGQAVAYFPFTALDTYLPKLVRAGVKICIADLPAAAPSAPAVAAAEPANDAAAPSYGDAEKSQNFEDVAVSVPEVQEYKLMYLFGGWVCDSCVYAETDEEAIQDATDNYITSRLPRWPYRVALWEGSRLVHEFKGDGPDDIGRRDMEQEESENAPAYIVHDTAAGPFHLDDCATGSILAAVDRLAKNGQTVNPHPLQLLADGVKIWDSEDSREELARIVRQRLAL